MCDRSVTEGDAVLPEFIVVTFAEEGLLHGGHALELRVGATCEMFVQVLDGTVSREKNEALGINLWTF